MKRFCICLLWVVGCSSGPKYRVDDMTLAKIPLAEKQEMMAAQTEQNQAKEELRKANADFQDTDRELDIANNDYKSAKLSLDTAEVKGKAAAQSGDLNRKEIAERDVHVAELAVKAADAKVDWLTKRRSFHKRERQAAEEHVAAADARYELEKAKIAFAHGIKPSESFNVTNFETESLQRSKRYSEARLDADKMKPDVDDLERKWRSKSETWQGARSSAAR